MSSSLAKELDEVLAQLSHLDHQMGSKRTIQDTDEVLEIIAAYWSAVKRLQRLFRQTEPAVGYPPPATGPERRGRPACAGAQSRPAPSPRTTEKAGGGAGRR